MPSNKRYHPVHVAPADMDGVSLPTPWPHSYLHGEADARQFLRAHPRDRTGSKTLRSACANFLNVIDAGLHAYFEGYLAAT